LLWQKGWFVIYKKTHFKKVGLAFSGVGGRLVELFGGRYWAVDNDFFRYALEGMNWRE